MDALYAHLLLDDLDLDARSQWVGKTKIQRCTLSATKQAISILAATVGHVYVTSTLQTCAWLDRLVLFVCFTEVPSCRPTWMWCGGADQE